MPMENRAIRAVSWGRCRAPWARCRTGGVLRAVMPVSGQAGAGNGAGAGAGAQRTVRDGRRATGQ
jgi:hypothetical protein